MSTHKIAAALCGALLAAAAMPSDANLLVNPGAESGSLVGWTVGGTSNPTVDNGSFDPGINPNSGSFDFLGGHGVSGTLTQTVSLAGIANAQVANVSFWEQGLNQGTPSDDGFVSLAFLDGTGATLATVSTAVVDSHDLTWQNYSGSFAIPTGTTSIAYTMNFTLNAGGDLDAFIDDNSLTVSAVPEPSEAALLGLGLAVSGVVVRRRRRAG